MKATPQLKLTKINDNQLPYPPARPRYRQVCVWLADQKKRKTYCLKWGHYTSFNEINKVADNIKELQKKKNALFKKNKMISGKAAIAKILGVNVSEENKVLIRARGELLGESSKIISSYQKKMEHKTDIDLILDEGTGNTTFLFGSSKKGKTTLMMHLYDRYYNDSDWIGTLFSPHAHIDHYKKHKLLLKCPVFHKDAQRYIRLEKQINNKCENLYDFVNLIDDVIDARHNKALNELVLTYRNSNISTVMCLQYSNLLAKSARANVNNIICFGFNSDEAVEVTVKSFLRDFFRKMGIIGLEEQIEFYKEVTADHGFIYIHPDTQHISFHRLSL